MKPLTDVEAFMNSMNKTYGTYTCIVLDNLEMLSQNLCDIIRGNLKKRNYSDRPFSTIICGDSFGSSKPYCIKTLEGYNEENIKFVVAKLMDSIPEEAEFIFVEMFLNHLGPVFSLPARKYVRLVIYKRP